MASPSSFLGWDRDIQGSVDIETGYKCLDDIEHGHVVYGFDYLINAMNVFNTFCRQIFTL